jgi:phosphate transport system ATP-binding protein
MSALDPISAGHIERQLFALKQDYTIVIVTRTLRQARRLADRFIFVYLGELIEHGPTETIFTEPSDPRTKAYTEDAFA